MNKVQCNVKNDRVVKRGDILRVNGSFYIVAQTGAHEYKLIDLGGGNRWSDNKCQSVEELTELLRTEGAHWTGPISETVTLLPEK